MAHKDDKIFASHNNIELRSEKVRQILGTIPKGLVHWGITIICVIFATLIVAVLCIDYPYGNGESIFQHLIFQ
jgi:hypothetical protein